MPTRRGRTAKATRRKTSGTPRHARAHCLQILKRLSAYLDDELPNKVCHEIREHVSACPKCETFLDSLRITIKLCRHSPARPLSPSARAKLRKEILRLARTA